MLGSVFEGDAFEGDCVVDNGAGKEYRHQNCPVARMHYSYLEHAELTRDRCSHANSLSPLLYRDSNLLGKLTKPRTINTNFTNIR